MKGGKKGERGKGREEKGEGRDGVKVMRGRSGETC